MERIDLKPGAPPRRQLEELRAERGSNRFVYLPHQGERERQRRLRRAERAAAKTAPAAG